MQRIEPVELFFEALAQMPIPSEWNLSHTPTEAPNKAAAVQFFLVKLQLGFQGTEVTDPVPVSPIQTLGAVEEDREKQMRGAGS